MLHETLRQVFGGPAKHPAAANPAVTIENLEIRGSNISLGPAAIDLTLTARGLRIAQRRDVNGKAALRLESAGVGEVEISAAKEKIEQAITAVASAEAGKHGVEIDQVQLTVHPRTACGLDAEVRLRARKLFISTTIQIAAKLDLDADLTATISGLGCTGQGVLGSLACTFLEPHLQKANGRSVSLLALPLGEVRLQNVRIAANERLTVRAEFR